MALDGALIRILKGDDYAVGCGVLITERHVATCAHVVAAALGVKYSQAQSPINPIRLDFPRLAPGQVISARVVPESWRPLVTPQFLAKDGDQDVAVLELLDPLPTGALPAPLNSATSLWKHNFRAFGFPQGGPPDGAWSSGVLLDRDARGLIQIQATTDIGYFVAPGFSGTPVWDDRLQAVIGLVVQAEPQPDRRVALGRVCKARRVE